jgi:hypothetical protein
MLASSIRVERPIERHIGRLGNLIDDVLRAIKKHLPLDAVCRAVFILSFNPLPIEFFTQYMQSDGFKAIAGIDPGSAAMRRAVGKCVAIGEVVLRHS